MCPAEAKCINSDGSYRCDCSQGLAFNGSNCEDIDECALSLCSQHATCLNLLGSFSCKCNSGFSGIGTRCDDIDECLVNNGHCHSEAICNNQVGAYTCTCKRGFSGDGVYQCTDVDECKVDNGGCLNNATCTNTLGSFLCRCASGFQLINGTICQDIDECVTGSGPCQFTEQCVNSPGSYQCLCKRGFSKANGITCMDVDECLSKPCDANAICNNSFGSFTCTCNAGFAGQGSICTDINECNLTGVCHSDAICSNFPGSYLCKCFEGFSGDGYLCTDINECLIRNDTCPYSTVCINSVGSYVCSCLNGTVAYNSSCELPSLSCKPMCHPKGLCHPAGLTYQCICDVGFEGNGLSCTDIDECKEDVCPDKQTTCINAPGSFSCVCKAGFSQNGSLCKDIDECLTGVEKCSPFAQCFNSIGSYHCQCLSGFSGDGLHCSDIDECQKQNGGCHLSATCTNTAGTYHCKCPLGMTGNRTECWDVDECADVVVSNCSENGQCLNSVGSYKCECSVGFEGDGHSCQDIDECDFPSICHSSTECKNTPGSYKCSCIHGFLNAKGICMDIVRCQNQSSCHEHAECIEMNGSFYCSCKPGFTGNGTHCDDLDECSMVSLQCHNSSTCHNTLGSYHCECLGGYEGNGTACYDINECLGSLACHENSIDECKENVCPDKQTTCINAPGSFSCVCKSGFSQNGSLCKDIDECLTGVEKCSPFAQCFNSIGSYHCQCLSGFSGDGLHCSDIDECQKQNGGCHPSATCTNTAGTYHCTCPLGMTGNRTECWDVDECADVVVSNCSENGQCLNSVGSYKCECSVGFEGDGHSCQDIDECDFPSICHSSTECKNTPGSYKCSCIHGFLNAKGICMDIGRCQNQSSCHEHAECIEMNGSFYCSCKPGFTGNGTHCDDLDECSMVSLQCHNSSTCHNTLGSYHCECLGGYEGNGTACYDINECLGSLACHENSSCINTDGYYVCQCKAGFTGNGSFCIDLDECLASGGEWLCANGSCFNTIGSFQCWCNDGFQSNGTDCVDIDECLLNITNCDVNSKCVNTGGSFECSCLSGFQSNGYLCSDIDECLNKTDHCHPLAKCTNLPGSYHCECPSGHVGDGLACTDVDECTETKSLCHKQALCLNTPGSYHCACKTGFISAGVICTDIDECQLDRRTCHAQALCVNTLGSFYCQCNQGFTGNGKTCFDINECDSPSSCQTRTKCTNSLGSYTCTSPANFSDHDPLSAHESLLYHYGEDVGDRMVLPTGSDVNSPYISPTMGIPFLGSLWERLYFSDNGLVQFQSPHTNEKYSFPNPPKNGFQGDEGMSMLAVFWDDSDLTAGDGKLLYQVYSKPDAQDVFSKIAFNRTTGDVNKYLVEKGDRAVFVPRWILKITWDHVLPISFQSSNASETNTFQCILTTDGNRTFALLKYSKMLWGPGQRVNHRALMGYTDGAGVFYNDPHTQQDNSYGPGGRYRPDQALGNTGLRGQWIYQLDMSEAAVNKEPDYRIMCQQWYLNEPDASSWTAGLTPCPCHSSQAAEDASFTLEVLPEEMAAKVQALRSLQTEGFVFQSMLPNKYNAGRRCTFSSQGYLLRGSSDRFFISSPAIPWVEEHINKDLLPFDWCCIKSSRCHMYYTKRPQENCDHYTPGGMGLVYGTLHVKTFDGTDYTFKGLGEFVLLRLSSSQGSNVFTLQGQTDAVVTDGRHSNVTAFVRLAAFYQGTSKVEWRPSDSKEELRVLVDDEAIDLNAGASYMNQDGFALSCPQPRQCSLVYYSGLQVQVEMGISGYLMALIKAPQSFYNKTVGLLGMWNSNHADDFLYSNGKRLASEDGKLPSEEELQDFGLSWSVPSPESLLHSNQPTRTFRPAFTAELLASVSTERLQGVSETCSGSEQCIHDTLATSSMAMGLQTAQYSHRFQKLTVIFGSMPPVLTGPSLIQCNLTYTAKVTFKARDPNNDTVIFSLVSPEPEGVHIGSADGVLTWTPRDTAPVMLTVQVNDQLSGSVLSPVLQVCNCANGGTCDYTSVIQNHHRGAFQVVGCLCPEGYSGAFCSDPVNACRGKPCFPGVACANQPSPAFFTCDTCPTGTVAQDKNGHKCFINNFCLPPFPFPCHEMAECFTSGSKYTCRCKVGFSGDGLNCTDINECENPAACPSAKYNCVNTIGSVTCSCRYQTAQDADACGNSENPPGWNVFNCTLNWNLLRSAPEHTTEQLRNILALGFQNKFYNASLKSVPAEGPAVEYRVNMSSDTPHWYVRDYLSRVSRFYSIDPATITVGDLNECTSGEANCSTAAYCENTYGGYKCICNSGTYMESESCVYATAFPRDNSTVTQEVLRPEDYTKLIVALVLGIGVPLLLLLLIAGIICFCCMRRKITSGDIPAMHTGVVLMENAPPPFNYTDPSLLYKVHCLPPMQNGKL
ncbi:fibrillin-1 isoform X2 [Polyodon spathula]|uniref:fibrillin-1 isoform X2 n=1 Tax=Polyodon spathula TaxID=7913 RepID=UPI001B7E673A|nr:fibrillin-1 isoform X2 [Polyodon spathula]